MKAQYVNYHAIRESLLQVQANWHIINDKLDHKRELTDEIVHNMLCAWMYADELVGRKHDIFSKQGLEDMLQLHNLVVSAHAVMFTDYSSPSELHDKMQKNYKKWRERQPDLEQAKREPKRRTPELQWNYNDRMLELSVKTRFYENIVPALKWWEKHKDDDNDYKRAAGVYVRLISKPQTFDIGNCRVAALVASIILRRSGKPPFVLNPMNAVDYLNPVGYIKANVDHNDWDRALPLRKVWHVKHVVADLFKAHVHQSYMLGNPKP
jgi:hypothetical protein